MMTDKVDVGVYKLHNAAFDPVYATEGSACFDIKACFPSGKSTITSFTSHGRESVLLAASDGGANHILLPPGDRVMIPTQLIFNIPDGWSMRLHMRSGLAVKGGLVLSNAEGVIDSDYTSQLLVPVTNTSAIMVKINHGDRICQGEMVPVYLTQFSSCAKPEPKTNRAGGFGSTGTT